MVFMWLYKVDFQRVFYSEIIKGNYFSLGRVYVEKFNILNFQDQLNLYDDKY